MQMRVDDVRDVFGTNPRSSQRSWKPFMVLVDLALFRVQLVPEAELDQHQRFFQPDGQRIQPEQDAIFLVRRSAPAPERLRDDAEHGAAIQEEAAVRTEREFGIAEGVTATHEFVVAGLRGGVG